MISERAHVLLEAHQALYGEELNGINLHGLAITVIRMAGLLDKDLVRRSLHAISRMHDDEEIELSFEEKMLLERRLVEIDRPSEKIE